jgi:hypothetical protein
MQLYAAATVSLIVYSNSVRRRHHLHRAGILLLGRSPWRHLLENGDEDSFLNLTGFSREAFDQMHDYLYGDHQDHVCVGRPRLLTTKDELGIILFYLGSKMRLSELCLIFGCTPTRCSNIIHDQLETLSRRLKHHRHAKIHWPFL